MAITNSQLAQSVSDLLAKWTQREDQYHAWVGGTAVGGPQDNGEYPLADPVTGESRLTKSPARLEQDVEGMVDSASSYDASASQAAQAAQSSEEDAEAAQAAALASRDAAIEKAGMADTAYQQAANERSIATTMKNKAKAWASAAVGTLVDEAQGLYSAFHYATKASQSADAASASEIESAQSAANAGASEVNALTKADEASAAADAADASEVLAQAWADNPEGVVVASGEYSAFHWAKKAQASSTGALVYRGSLDASAGTYPPDPMLGDLYKITVAGTIGDTGFNTGDQIIYNGSSWDKVDNTDSVTAVAGKVGSVALYTGDISGLQSALDNKADTTSIPTNNTQLLNGQDYVVNQGSAAFATLVLTGSEGRLQFESDDYYLYNNSNNMGLYSSSNGLAFSYSKATRLFEVNGSIEADNIFSGHYADLSGKPNLNNRPSGFTIEAQDNSAEGGEIHLAGAGAYPAGRIDMYADKMRFFGGAGIQPMTFSMSTGGLAVEGPLSSGALTASAMTVSGNTALGSHASLSGPSQTGLDIIANTNDTPDASQLPYINLKQAWGAVTGYIMVDSDRHLRLGCNNGPIILEGNVEVTGTVTENAGSGVYTPPAPTCPTGDTPIQLPDGSAVRADELVVGQDVASMDVAGLDPADEFAYRDYERARLDGSQRVTTTVTAVESFTVSQLIQTQLASHAAPLCVSPEHPYLVWDGDQYQFKRADALTVEDQLIQPDTTASRIESVARLSGSFKVYKISCEPYDIYIHAGVIGHNSKA